MTEERPLRRCPPGFLVSLQRQKHPAPRALRLLGKHPPQRDSPRNPLFLGEENAPCVPTFIEFWGGGFGRERKAELVLTPTLPWAGTRPASPGTPPASPVLETSFWQRGKAPTPPSPLIFWGFSPDGRARRQKSPARCCQDARADGRARPAPALKPLSGFLALWFF